MPTPAPLRPQSYGWSASLKYRLACGSVLLQGGRLSLEGSPPALHYLEQGGRPAQLLLLCWTLLPPASAQMSPAG